MREFLETQYENKFLWAAISCILGAALYFTLSWEISNITWIIGIIFSIALFIGRRNPIARILAIFLFGAFYAAAYSHIIPTPQITRNMRDITFSARVTGIDYTADKTRLLLDSGDINPDSFGRMTVRVNLGDEMPIPNIGDMINVTATLFRPNGQYAPETFDFARWAYFNGISATGYLTNIEIISHEPHEMFAHLRDAIHRITNSFLVDGLMLGYNRAVPATDGAIWTTNGIGHVWSISGFHMTLVSGWLFAIFYMILRCIPFITRRIPARIPAIILAWIGLGFYLMISGAGVATIRAFLMITLVFAATILGRHAISLRNICIAMLIVFLINPHYVMQAGFQLSFAAVFGLVYFFGNNPKMPKNKLLKIIYAAAMTSVVATIFTAPFIATHFQLMPVYSLIGNLILLPIFSFIIMPCIMIGAAIAAIGWMGPIIAAHTVYDITLQIAVEIANLPMANISMPHIPNIAMILFILALVCLVFIKPVNMGEKFVLYCMRKINIIMCVILTTLAIILTVTQPRPVIYATYDHELIAFRDGDGMLRFNKSRASNHFFAFDTWKQFNGEKAGTNNIRIKCERGVCRYSGEKFQFVYIQKFVPLAREINKLCRAPDVDYIASYFNVDAPNCNATILRGPFIIYSSGRVRPILHRRIWHNPHQ